MGACDVVLRSLMGVLAVLIIGVGIWMAIDSLHEEPGNGCKAIDGEKAASTNHLIVLTLPE